MCLENWQYQDPASGLTVSVSRRVLQTFDRFRQHRFWQCERGGVLFARSVGSEGVLELCEATSPHERDQAGWGWLELNHERCLVEIRDRFRQGLHFVGYWHTHPERHPTPSPRDFAALRRNLEQGGVPLQKLLAIIVGTTSDTDSLCVATVAKGDAPPSRFVHVRDCIGECLEPATR